MHFNVSFDRFETFPVLKSKYINIFLSSPLWRYSKKRHRGQSAITITSCESKQHPWLQLLLVPRGSQWSATPSPFGEDGPRTNRPVSERVYVSVYMYLPYIIFTLPLNFSSNYFCLCCDVASDLNIWKQDESGSFLLFTNAKGLQLSQICCRMLVEP